MSFFLIVSNLDVRGQESDVGYLVFVDSTHSVSNASRNFSKKMTSLSTIDTIKSRREKIVAVFDSSDEMLRDGVIHCLRMAMNLWEDRVNFTVPIYLYVKSDPNLDPNIEIKTIVKYSRVSAQKSQPSSLYYQNYIGAVNTDSIIINANVNWDFSWAYDIGGGNDNLTSAFLRHISHILGFGTSVTSLNGQIGFCIKRTYSDFDGLIVNSGGQTLSSLAWNGNSSTIGYFMKDSIHLTLPSGNYNLYSNQNDYIPYRSGKYFNLSDNNIMNYPYEDRTQLLNINKETLEALQTIGWETSPYGIAINSSTLNTVGYGSVYKNHVFNAVDENGYPIQSATWKYQEFHKSTKQYTNVSTATGSQISISNININNDCIDDDNCLQGRIVCSITNGGVSQDYTMPVFLELAPELDSFEVMNIETSSYSNYYSFDIKLNCLGNTNGILLVCNEYGQTLNYNINSSGEVLIHVSNVLKYGQTYVDITLNNSYGSNSKIFYLDNIQNTNARANKTSESLHIMCNRNGEYVDGKVIVTDNDSLTFSFIDKKQMEKADCHIQWYLKLFKFNNITYLHELAKDTTICSLRVSTLLFNNEVPIQSFYILQDGLYCDGSIRAIITKSNGEEYVYDYPIRFDVLPKTPTVEIVNYKEMYDELSGEINPLVELKIVAERYKIGHVQTTQGTWFGAIGEQFKEGTPMPHHVKIDWGSLGAGYNCILGNEYGSVECDYVYPSIMANMSDMRESSLIRLTHSGHYWTVECARLVDLMEILDIRGVVYASQKHVSHINAFLTPGIYVLCLLEEGKTYYRKFIVK